MGNGVNIVRTIVGLKPKIPLDEQLRNACFFGQRDVADEIIAQIPRGPGGLVDGMDPIGYTPIMYAAGSGYPEILEALLQHGADINHQAQNGLTAMHKAAEAGKIKCLHILLMWRADINIQSRDGYTPAMCASLEKKDHFLKVLIESKADLTLRDNLGNTCLDLAKHGGTIDLLEQGMRERADLEAQRRQQLADKKALLEGKIREARSKEENAKRKRRGEEEAALKIATERNLLEMKAAAKRHNDEYEAAKKMAEQQEAEARMEEVRRAEEIIRTRRQTCSDLNLSLPLVAAYFTLKNQYVLTRLLSCSKSLKEDKNVSPENQEVLINLMQTLTEEKKSLIDQLLLLNLVAVLPAEYISVGRWGGVLGQVNWLLARVCEELAGVSNSSAASQQSLEKPASSVEQELLKIKTFFHDNDSPEGQAKHQRELEMQKAALALAASKAEEETTLQMQQAEARRQMEAHAVAKAEAQQHEQKLMHQREALCNELGLPLPLSAAFLALSNSVCMARIMNLNAHLSDEEGPQRSSGISSTQEEDDALLAEMKALSNEKKALGHQLLDPCITKVVPQSFLQLGGFAVGVSRSDAGIASLMSQLDWLVCRVRELQAEDVGKGSIEGASIEEKDVPTGGHAETVSHVTRKVIWPEGYSDEHVYSLRVPGSPSWHRDHVLAALAHMQKKLVGDREKEESTRAHGLLQKLEELKRSQRTVYGSKDLTAELREEQEKEAYFAAKEEAQRQKAEAELRKAEAPAARSNQVVSEASLAALGFAGEKPGNRRGDRSSAMGGPSEIDLSSVKKFRDATLGRAT